jgi:hypothetical protein
MQVVPSAPAEVVVEAAAPTVEPAPSDPAPVPARDPAELAPEPRKRRPRTKSHPRIVEPVIPLAHIPDDPGPEADTELEPSPELSQAARRRTLF